MSNVIDIEIPVLISYHPKTSMPKIELRKNTTNPYLIQKIIRSAYHGNQPLTFIPKFTDRIQSIASLVDKGILYYDPEQGQYFFNLPESWKQLK